MSLFEDLIDELKEDNLLEETVIESVQATEKARSGTGTKVTAVEDLSLPSTQQQSVVEDSMQEEILPTSVINEPDDHPIAVKPEDIIVAVDENMVNVEATVVADIKENVLQQETSIIDAQESVTKAVSTPSKTDADEKEFYRRRALDEVNGLEMVDHVLTGVEREMMKVIPKPYDSYEVKQALHDFLQVAEDIQSPKHAELEFNLMKETEKWYSVLSERDKDITVSSLRRYCETTKPSLSSQALMSLARFYRNSPYSEAVRSKFDLVVSKLFSRDVEDDKRELLFKAEELVNHIQELYADWSSTPLYSTDENDSELLLAALKFQDFISEAEKADNFDELVKKDFFKRLKVFKEKTNENFFAPILVAAAVECNVAVGNQYIELIQQVRDDSQSGSLSNKYGNVHDKAISEATSKTLELVAIVSQKKADGIEGADAGGNNVQNNNGTSKPKSTYDERRKKGLFGANWWLVAATIITIISGAVYFLTGSSSATSSSDVTVSDNVKIVNLENSSLKEYVESARISENTMFAITNETWETRAFKDKEGVVDKFLRTGEEKGFNKVHFLNKKGETVAFGSEKGINIVQ